MNIVLVDTNDIGGRQKNRSCLRCNKTTEEILRERPTLKKVFWRKGICDPCFHKLKRKCRNKELPKDHRTAKGFRIEMVIGKVLGIKVCSIELDNFNSVFDLYDPIKYKEIQVRSCQYACRKTAYYNGKKYEYYTWHIPLDLLKEYDTLFAVCMTEGYKDIYRIYIIPVDKLPDTQGFDIYKDPKDHMWYEEYRVDEKPYNDMYHSMKIEDCPVIKNDK